MALNKDILGTNIYNALGDYNNKNPDEAGDIEAFRLAACKVIADEVIKHFIAAGVVTLNPAGLTAGVNPVVGTAIGTIS